jgi:hypothetical protein
MSIISTTLGKIGAAGLVAALSLGGAALTTSSASAVESGPATTQTTEFRGVLTMDYSNFRYTDSGMTGGVNLPYQIFLRPWVQGTAINFVTPGPGTQVSRIPGVDQVGPWSNDDRSLCVNRVAESLMLVEACNGSATQQWKLRKNMGSTGEQIYFLTSPDGKFAINSFAWATSGTLGEADGFRASTFEKSMVEVAIAARVDMTGPAEGSTVDTATPVISGTGEPGATITVTDKDGNVIGTTTVGDDKTWTLTPTNPLPQGPNTVTVEQDAKGAISTDSGSFVVEIPAVIAELTATVKDKDDAAKTAELTGTGQPGATITVTTPTGPVTTIVDGEGKWTVTAPGLAVGSNELPITQTIDGVEHGNTTVTVIIEALEIPALAGVGLFGLTAAGAGLIALRRKRANAAA